MEKEIKNENIQQKNIGEDKNTYGKIVDLIKSLMPKNQEETKVLNKEDNPKNSDNIKLIEKYEKLKNELNQQKQIIKENQIINLLKQANLDGELKNVINYHPNPKEAIETLKNFKDKTLKTTVSYTPMGEEVKKNNKVSIDIFTTNKK